MTPCHQFTGLSGPAVSHSPGQPCCEPPAHLLHLDNRAQQQLAMPSAAAAPHCPLYCFSNLRTTFCSLAFACRCPYPTDDYAPPQQKARWFATFYLCIPVGFAAGYIYGGLVASALGWRAAFMIESAVMVPFVVFAFVSRPLHLAGSRDAGPGEIQRE